MGINQLSRRLNAVGLSLQEDFDSLYRNRSCSCHRHPPCSYCTHPGNPLNLEESDDVWETGMICETVESNQHDFKYMVGYFFPSEMKEMIAWLTETFGPYSHGWKFIDNTRWYCGNSHFVFKTEADRNWFVMRWSS